MGPLQFAWRISPQLYAWRVRGASPVEGLPSFLCAGVADAALAGYRGVEFGLSTLQAHGRPSAVRRLLTENQLQLSSLFTEVEEDAEDCVTEQIARMALVLQEFECPTLILATKSVRTGAPPCRPGGIPIRLAAALRNSAIRVCWHPHEEHFANGCEQLIRIFEETAEDKTGICLDLGWVQRCGADPATVIRLCGPRLRYLHVREYAGGHWMQSLGHGQLDLHAVFEALGKIGYLGWMAVELWFERGTEITRSVAENAAVSLRHLHAAAKISSA